MRAAGSVPEQLLLQCGKDGNVWMIDRENLGGIGGDIFVKQASSSVRALCLGLIRTGLSGGRLCKLTLH